MRQSEMLITTISDMIDIYGMTPEQATNIQRIIENRIIFLARLIMWLFTMSMVTSSRHCTDVFPGREKADRSFLSITRKIKVSRFYWPAGREQNEREMGDYDQSTA